MGDDETDSPSEGSLTQTIIPTLTDAIYTTSVDFLQEYTNYLDIIGDFSDYVDTFIQYWKALNSSEFVNNSVDIFQGIDDDVDELDNQFLVYWLSKYQRSISTIQQIVSTQAPDDSIFNSFSDSIGLLSNTIYMLTDSVIPYNDIDSSMYPAPITYPTNLANKIRPNSLEIAMNLSQNTTTIFRQNIINIQFQYATSDEAHGSNLITDIAAYSRARDFVSGIVGQLQEDFENTFKLVSYYCNINDNTGYNPGDYTLNTAALNSDLFFSMFVEDTPIDIDLLGKKIQDTRSSLTIAAALVNSSS